MRKGIAALLALCAIISCGKGEEPDTPDQGQPVPSVPQNVKLHNATENSLTFQWDAVQGAASYQWKLTKDGAPAGEGKANTRNATVGSLEQGTTYGFSVCAVGPGGSSAYSAVVEGTTKGTKPLPPDPSSMVLCVDAPLVIPFDQAPVLGKSGLVQVFKADGTLVDKIDLSDISKVDVLSDGTMIPKGADADAGVIAINNDTPFHTFMDALHSAQYRIVHYTPLRVNGKTLEIKLHNEALSFGESYYVTVDASVAGKAVGKDDMPFTVKAAPSGSTLKVAADGSGDFCTVQGALSYVSRAVKKDDAVTIEIGEGIYQELLFLRNKNNVTIKGVSREKSVIAYPNNDSYETGSGSSVSARPSLGASIGKSGGRSVFLVEGCDNLVLENLTIENTYSIPSHKGQAETIYFNSSYRLTVENCALVSWQDTFLCKGKVWVHNSLIAGHVDYIWGYPEACLFEDCEIRSRAGGYIVQARVPSTSSKGFVFLNCKLTAESGVKDGSMYLARSGGSTDYFDNVVYVNCTMDPVIAATGWFTKPAPNPSAPTATSGWREFGSVDASGKAVTGHNAYGKVLTAAEAEPYSSRKAVLGW